MKAHPNFSEPVLFTQANLESRWQVCGLTLRRWRKSGKIKALHLGRGIRFTLAEVERVEREATV